MTNEKTQLSRWLPGRQNFEKLVFMHRSLGQMSRVAEYLIYEDDNFPTYLAQALLNQEKHAFFYDPHFGADAGFCHMVIADNSLFLNNIFVDPNHHRQGLGKRLFGGALELLNSDLGSYDNIELDLFSSNRKALSWYEKIGFTPRRKISWRIFGDLPALTSPKIELRQDAFGFQQIYVGGKRIGSRINERAVLADGCYATHLGTDLFRSIIIKQDLSLPALQQTEPVEVSTRLLAPMTAVNAYFLRKGNI